MTSEGSRVRAVRLLGPPSVTVDGVVMPPPRGHKPWGLIAHLLLSSGPVTRTRLAGLLFGDAEDPLAALRWNLTQVRRVLDLPGGLQGDPLSLRVGAGGDVQDVDVLHLLDGLPSDAPPPDGLGQELLDGMDFSSSPSFDVWLASTRRHARGAAESFLHERALAALAADDPGGAADAAARLVALEPLDEDYQALLVRSLAVGGDGVAAARQVAACRELFRRELGVDPGPALEAAARTLTRTPTAAPAGGAAAVRALVDAGNAAIGAGAVDSGLECLRRAVADAEALEDDVLRGRALVDLGSSLVHAVRGRDEEGATALHQALAATDRADVVVDACRELGYVEFMRGRYDRVEGWLRRADEAADADAALTSGVLVVRGMTATDVGRYGDALTSLKGSVALSPTDRDRSYPLSMLGRVQLLLGDLDGAEAALRTSSDLARATGRTGLLPWPEALLAEVEIERGDLAGARARLDDAFALGCHLGDPCWEGAAGRGLGRVLLEEGRVDEAVATLSDARTRCTRLPDGYLWLDSWILDLLCRAGVEHDLSGTSTWVDELAADAARRGMRELEVRALLHRRALGLDVDDDSLRALAALVDNPLLAALLPDLPREVRHP